MEILIAIPIVYGALFCVTPSCNLSTGQGCKGNTMSGVVVYHEDNWWLHAQGSYFPMDDLSGKSELFSTKIPKDTGRVYACQKLSTIKDFNATDAFSVINGHPLKEVANCYSDGIHKIPGSGKVQLSGGHESLSIKWGPKFIPKERVPNAPIRHKRRVIGCPVQSVPFLGTGAAVCNLGGLEDDLKAKIQERYDETQKAIKAAAEEEQQDFDALGDKLAKQREKLATVGEAIGRYAKSLTTFEAEFDKYVEGTMKGMEYNQAQVAHETVRALRAEAYISTQVLINSVKGGEEMFYVSLRFPGPNCSLLAIGGTPDLLPLKRMAVFMTANTLQTHALLDALHNATSDNLVLLHALKGAMNGTLQIEGKEAQTIKVVGNHSMEIAGTLNKVLKADADDLADALDGDAGTHFWIAYVAVACIQGTILFFQIRAGADNHRLWDFLWKASVSLSFLVIGLTTLVAEWLSVF